MKLRNKKTGYVDNWCIDKDVIRTCDGSIVYNSIAELNEEWEDAPEEDYEEPKIFWYIEGDGDIHSIGTELCDELEIHTMKQIGNYFETKEEAEKAVEKLKAYKRLKDLGFKCSYHSNGYHRGTFTADFIFDEDKLPIIDTFVVKDLELLFGGKE